MRERKGGHLDSHAAHVMLSVSSSCDTSTLCLLMVGEVQALGSMLQMSAAAKPKVARIMEEEEGSTAIPDCSPSKSAAATTEHDDMFQTMMLLLPTAVSAMTWRPS